MDASWGGILHHDDTGIDNNVCITVGDVELCCRDVLVGCLGCIREPNEGCVTDGVAALFGCLLCVHVDDGDWIADGLVGLCCLGAVVADVG